MARKLRQSTLRPIVRVPPSRRWQVIFLPGFGTSAEMAKAIVFLASEAFAAGSELVVDGGMSNV